MEGSSSQKAQNSSCFNKPLGNDPSQQPVLPPFFFFFWIRLFTKLLGCIYNTAVTDSTQQKQKQAGIIAAIGKVDVS